MWALPDIRGLNANARLNRQRLEDCAANFRTPENMRKTAHCECKDWGGRKCGGNLNSYLTYDIFSDAPKGVLFLCEEHDGYSGSPVEGYFTCDDCGRVMIENYTWELYYVANEDGIMCLDCYAKKVIADPEEWLSTDEETVKALTFDQVRDAKHIFAVSGPRYNLTEFGDGATFDSMTGQTVVGSSSTCSSDLGLRDIQDSMRAARDAGCDKVLLVLDGGYQFACSIGVYGIPPKSATEPQEGQETPSTPSRDQTAQKPPLTAKKRKAGPKTQRRAKK